MKGHLWSINSPIDYHQRQTHIKRSTNSGQAHLAQTSQYQCQPKYQQQYHYRLKLKQKQKYITPQSSSHEDHNNQSSFYSMSNNYSTNSTQQFGQLHDQTNLRNEFRSDSRLLCCRVCFNYDEIVDQPESVIYEYKKYTFPFSKEKTDQLKRTICGFLNYKGGFIFLGISQNSQTKQHKVKGQTYTQYQKQQLLKSLRQAAQCIHPNILFNPKLKVSFVPVKNSSYPYSYIAGRFVVKVKVWPGARDELYTWRADSGDYFVCVRTQNQVLSLGWGDLRSVLGIYRERLINAVGSKEDGEPAGVAGHQCKEPEQGCRIFKNQNNNSQMSFSRSKSFIKFAEQKSQKNQRNYKISKKQSSKQAHNQKHIIRSPRKRKNEQRNSSLSNPSEGSSQSYEYIKKQKNISYNRNSNLSRSISNNQNKKKNISQLKRNQSNESKQSKYKKIKTNSKSKSKSTSKTKDGKSMKYQNQVQDDRQIKKKQRNKKKKQDKKRRKQQKKRIKQQQQCQEEQVINQLLTTNKNETINKILKNVKQDAQQSQNTLKMNKNSQRLKKQNSIGVLKMEKSEVKKHNQIGLNQSRVKSIAQLQNEIKQPKKPPISQPKSNVIKQQQQHENTRKKWTINQNYQNKQYKEFCYEEQPETSYQQQYQHEQKRQTWSLFGCQKMDKTCREWDVHANTDFLDEGRVQLKQEEDQAVEPQNDYQVRKKYDCKIKLVKKESIEEEKQTQQELLLSYQIQVNKQQKVQQQSKKVIKPVTKQNKISKLLQKERGHATKISKKSQPQWRLYYLYKHLAKSTNNSKSKLNFSTATQMPQKNTETKTKSHTSMSFPPVPHLLHLLKQLLIINHSKHRFFGFAGFSPPKVDTIIEQFRTIGEAAYVEFVGILVYKFERRVGEGVLKAALQKAVKGGGFSGLQGNKRVDIGPYDRSILTFADQYEDKIQYNNTHSKALAKNSLIYYPQSSISSQVRAVTSNQQKNPQSKLLPKSNSPECPQVKPQLKSIFKLTNKIKIPNYNKMSEEKKAMLAETIELIEELSGRKNLGQCLRDRQLAQVRAQQLDKNGQQVRSKDKCISINNKFGQNMKQSCNFMSAQSYSQSEFQLQPSVQMIQQVNHIEFNLINLYYSLVAYLELRQYNIQVVFI